VSRPADEGQVLRRVEEIAERYRAELGERRVGAEAGVDELREAFAMPLAEEGAGDLAVIEELAAAAAPGLVANGPRWFGFVDGGSLPIALAADWLTSGWDQNAGLAIASPAAAVAEEVAAGWLRELLGLPAEASVGLVTGGQMANFTGLAAARGALLARENWDVGVRGLRGSPQLHVVIGEEAHVTILAALRMLGLGTENVRRVAADGQGRMSAEALRATLVECDGPTLICALAGNVHTGAFDPFGELADAAAEHGDAWLHVDGAFGLWAATVPSLRDQLEGVERADSWALDAHKWLNVPYDCGIAIVRDPDAHRAALSLDAAYLVRDTGAESLDRTDYVPEASRRARGFVLYATLRALGRKGIAELVDRCCAHARRFAELFAREPGVEVMNEVVLNQVLVRFPAADDAATDARTSAVIAAVQEEGTCWCGPTTWRGRTAMRISVVNWSTTNKDVERSAAAILGAARAEAIDADTRSW
jgi:glutamate/tyrosine decarboxylase-like PLP-dependent enzyme